jgi:hypothetical protein
MHRFRSVKRRLQQRKRQNVHNQKKDQTSCATVFTLRFEKLAQSHRSSMSNFPGWTEQIDLQNLD